MKNILDDFIDEIIPHLSFDKADSATFLKLFMKYKKLNEEYILELKQKSYCKICNSCIKQIKNNE